jgi:type II secretory pathway component GspD/PulD (secretin)
MQNGDKHHDASDILQALHELTLEPEVNYRIKPLSELRSELTSAGISTVPLLKRVKEAIAQAKAEQELIAARERRQIALEKLKSLNQAVTDAPAQLREKIRSLLENLSVGDPAAASAFFSKFEKATDADLQSLLDDLAFLDGNDDESNGAET